MVPAQVVDQRALRAMVLTGSNTIQLPLRCFQTELPVSLCYATVANSGQSSPSRAPDPNTFAWSSISPTAAPARTMLRPFMSAVFVVGTMPHCHEARSAPDPSEALALVNRPQMSPHPKLIYPDFSSLIHQRPQPTFALNKDIELYKRVVTPYDSAAFAHLLDKFNLSESYPLLVANLNNGFPLGNLPLLTQTTIIKNHPSADKNLAVVQEYLDTELAANRMSGPFDQATTEQILRGPFY